VLLKSHSTGCYVSLVLHPLLSERGIEQQLRDNLGAAQWELTLEELNLLNQVSAIAPIYPYWHQRKFGFERIPQ
jgi:hypothetical protein